VNQRNSYASHRICAGARAAAINIRPHFNLAPPKAVALVYPQDGRELNAHCHGVPTPNDVAGTCE